MSENSKIEWTEATWNPVTGCTKVSPGCDHCYAERITERFHGKGSFAEVKLHADRLEAPLRWRKPRRVFVNSMSDLFHDAVPDEFIARVFAVMAATPQHTYQILTKRHGRMRPLLSRHGFWLKVGVACLDNGWWPPNQGISLDAHYLPNVWLGVSVEDQKRADLRIPALLETPAAVRFVSAEPLLGPIDLSSFLTGDCPECGDDITSDACGLLHANMGCDPTATGLSWVIVGGESGPDHRSIDPQWVRHLRDACLAKDVAFFLKQWGGRTPKSGGRLLDGRTWDEYPTREVGA